MDHVARLAVAGTDVEFHLYPGAPHAFEVFAPHAAVAQQAIAARARFLRIL